MRCTIRERPVETTQRSAAFAAAQAGLDRLGIPDALIDLAAVGLQLSRTVLGGSHSVAVYPPIDSLVPIEPPLVTSLGCGKTASLYIHIAFCETRCTFCHYVVDHYPTNGRSHPAAAEGSRRYLTALKREMRLWAARLADSGTAITSIYIGGGTPLILPPDLLEDILHTVRAEFRVAPGAEFCVEGSPLTITAPDGEDKLRLLRKNGVNRLSFGVQSFDDDVLKYAARGYTRETPIKAATLAAGVFDNWNIDLIQGLYKGSPREVWNNLEAIAEIQPPHITWYHGRYGNRPQGHWYNMAQKQDGFEDELDTLFGRMLLWQEMARLGYQQCDGNRFVRDQNFADPFKPIRTSASSNLIGIGAASYSHICGEATTDGSRGYIFRNETDIRAYVSKVSAGEEPIATGRCIDEDEFFAQSYATGLRSGRVETDDIRDIAARRPTLTAHYDAIVRSLERVHVLEGFRSPQGQSALRFSQLGRLFEDETLSLFFSPAVKAFLSEASGRRDPG